MFILQFKYFFLVLEIEENKQTTLPLPKQWDEEWNVRANTSKL